MKKFKMPKTLFDKVKDIDAEFVSTVYTLTEDQLKERLISLAKYDEEMDKARSEDTDLASKKEEVKVANETYSIPLKANKLKRKLVLQIMKERGKA